MYRQRIKDWSLDKNHKDKEMKAVVRKHEGRIAKGKASTIRIRGRDIDYRDVVRYWKRKNLSIDAVLALRSLSKTPEAVECFTPLPSPIKTPEVFAVPESIFRTLRDYHRGSLEAGVWRSIGENALVRTTKFSNAEINWAITLFHHCLTYIDLMENNSFEEANCEFSRICATIEKVIHAEDPATFSRLLRLVPFAYSRGEPKIVFDILGHVSAVGGLVLGDQHPFKLVCGWLASLDPVDRRLSEDILGRSTKMIYETFKGILGPLHFTTIYSLLEHFYLVQMSDQNIGNQKLALRNLLNDCETTLGPDDPRTMHVRLRLAWHYLYQREYTAAKEEVQGFVIQNILEAHQINGLEVLAESLYGLNEIHEAFVTLRQAIDLAIREWGVDDTEIQHMMLTLERWMLKQGMPESAAQVREERLRLRDCETDSGAAHTDLSYDPDTEWIEGEL